MEIHLILGLRAQESLLTSIQAEQLPNVSIQRNSSNKELLLFGKVGISSELFDVDEPTFYVHRSRIDQLKEEYRKHELKKDGNFQLTNDRKHRK